MNPKILMQQSVPMPLHGIAPRTIMPATEWKAMRKSALEKSGHTCEACGAKQDELKEGLNVHENYRYDYPAGRSYFEGVSVLCVPCHNYIHCQRLLAISIKGNQTDSEYLWGILYHGNEVLSNAMRLPNPNALSVAHTAWNAMTVWRPEKNLPYWTQMINNFHSVFTWASKEYNDEFGIASSPVEWSAWRLVYNGQEYEPMHKNEEEYRKFYGGKNARI